MDTSKIEIRYSELATDDCCLSCGGAINHGKAQPGEVCLDIGSGRGNDVLRLAEEVGETGFAYGVDITEAMLKKAEKNAKKLGIENVKFLKSSIEVIPLEDNSIDLVISNCTINHATDKVAVWSEINRVLKSGGRFVVSDIYSTSEVPEEYRNDPEAVAECWAGSTTKEVYLEILEKAGFKNLEVIEESKPYLKGKIECISWTISAKKKGGCCCTPPINK